MFANMLDALRFVKGAVASKDFLPAITHFVIEKHTVRAYNGQIALCAPIPIDLECKPKGETFFKAIQACKGNISLTLTPTGKLSVRSGKFRAFVETITGDTPHLLPEGQIVGIQEGERLLKGLKAVAPFMGQDASRKWTNSVLFKDGKLYATNNVCLVEYDVGEVLPGPFAIHAMAVNEMLRVATVPHALQWTQGSVTFHYAKDTWIRSQLVDANWPDLQKILGKSDTLTPIPEGLFEAILELKPFLGAEGRVFFKPGKVSTTQDDETETSVDVPGLQDAACYHFDMIRLLQHCAERANFSTYPQANMFAGENLRGAIIGMKA